MSYQDICRGLYKKASNEQLNKLASLIGMRKKAKTQLIPKQTLGKAIFNDFQELGSNGGWHRPSAQMVEIDKTIEPKYRPQVIKFRAESERKDGLLHPGWEQAKEAVRWLIDPVHVVRGSFNYWRNKLNGR